jgi:hypothetical protein
MCSDQNVVLRGQPYGLVHDGEIARQQRELQVQKRQVSLRGMEATGYVG